MIIARSSQAALLLLLGSRLVLPLPAQDTSKPAATASPQVQSDSPATSVATVRTPPKGGQVEGRIAFLTARMLEQLNYLKQPFDATVSSNFLNRYIEAYDPQHIHFTQADLADFEHYRTNLNTLTLRPRGISDLTPATEIFERYYERLQARVAFVTNLLAHEKFSFDTDDRIAINRKDLPYPKDLDDAHKLWRERLRFEYLQELLAKITAKKKPDSVADKKEPAVKPKSDEEQIVETLTHRYQRNLRVFRDFTMEDVLQVYLSALAHVYDPHSDYLGRAQLESFAIGMNLSLFGIGAELRWEDGYCTINRLLPGGPAIKSGKIKEKDRIIAVAQGDQTPVDVVDMVLTKAVQLIRGPKGTEVRLTIIPAGADAASHKVISLIRDEIPLEDQAAKAKLLEVPQGKDQDPLRLGIIDLPSFYATFDPTNAREKGENKSTTADVQKLLTKLKQEKVSGIILDLRRNGGGSLEEAIKLTGLFIKRGTVVQVMDSDGHKEKDDDTDPSVWYDGPLVVLTSRFSASASEILAGALQDYGRAVIVGDSSTHGKGTVQSVNSLAPFMHLFNRNYTNEPGALKVTIKKFYRASGASTQERGVVPDIVLPSVLNESKDIGEDSLENPMPYDTIESAKYEHMDRVDPYLPELRTRSDQRVATDPEFTYIREDMELYKKQQEDKTISLNQKQRLKEKDEMDARQKARDKERLARGEPQQTVYEITLKLADKPGLPPPVEKTNTVAKLQRSSVVPTAATNAALAAAADPAGAAEPTADELDEEKPPAIDVNLLEAEHILADYVAAMAKRNVASVATPVEVR